jgi:hypothetical protein
MFTGTNGKSARPLSWCKARAMRSFPVPLSPAMSTGCVDLASRRT